MTRQSEQSEQTSNLPAGGNRVLSVLKILGYLVTVGLLVASIWYALKNQRAEDWRVLLTADPRLLAGLFAAVFVSTILLKGLQFWLATLPFVTTRPLGFGAITAVGAGSQLLNYTPFKAGLITRIGYLRYVHGVGYRAAIISTGLLLACFGAACVIALGLTLWLPGFGIPWVAACGFALLLTAVLLLPLLRAAIPEEMSFKGPLSGSWLQGIGYLMLCLIVQILIQLFVAVRWWIAFRMLGQSADLPTVWVLAILHMVTEIAGPANGLGLREWLVGLVGGMDIAGISPAFNMADGLTASLLDRAVEAVVVILIGTVALFILRRIATGYLGKQS